MIRPTGSGGFPKAPNRAKRGRAKAIGPKIMVQSQQLEQEAVTHCHWHPGVETRLYCRDCGKHVCTQCMVQAPVGIKCRECGKAMPAPTFDVQPSYYARAVGVAVATAIGGGLLWSLFMAIFPIFPSIAGMAVGYAAGELISRSVNRKRGVGLACIAAGSVVGAFLVALIIMGPFFGLIGLLIVGFSIYTAVQRVR